MRKTLLLLSGLSAITLLANQPKPIEPVSVTPDEILFLAHFNQTTKPEIGNTKGMISSCETTSGNKGYPFKDSAPKSEALNANGYTNYVAFPAAGNFDREKGTLQMFVKGKWVKGGASPCVFFKLFFSSKLDGDWGSNDSFVLQRTGKTQTFKMYQNGNARVNGVVSKEFPYSVNDWHHLTVTWDLKSSSFSLYVDGELSGTWKHFRKIDKNPMYMILSHPRGWNARSLIDEVRILNRPLTAQEVKQDYLYLTSGKEFPSLVTKGKEYTFYPKKAKIESTGFAATLEPIDFRVGGLSREINMDGKLSDEAWKNAPQIPLMLNRRNKKEIQYQAKVRLLYSPTALYIGAVMDEPDMKNLVASLDQDDLTVYNDDCLEFVIDPNGRGNLYHFAVNALGSVYDAKNNNKNWNLKGRVVKTSRQDNSWTIEMKLPFASFGLLTPEPGEFWGARFCRERHHGNALDFGSIPVVQRGFGSAFNLAKLLYLPAANEGVKLISQAKHITMGMNNVALEVQSKKAENFTLRARTFDENGNVLTEVTKNINVPTKTELSFPVDNDKAVNTIISLAKDGKTIDSLVLQRNFAYVKPGLIAMDKNLEDLENSCANLLKIKHPIHQGAAASVKRMRQAIRDYQKLVKESIAKKVAVPAEKTAEIADLANGFNHFRDKFSYLVWEGSPWENGSPFVLPSNDYSNHLQLNFRQASNEREHAVLVISGLLLNRRLDLRIMPYSVNQRNVPYIHRSKFEVYLEPFIDHMGELITQPLIKVPGNIVTITPGNSVRVRIVFNSRGVPAGNYQTKIMLKPVYDFTVANREIPVNMEVWNFTLPETRDWPIDSFFWGPNIFDNDESEMLKLMHSRHINWGWTEACRYINGFRTEDSRIRLPKGKLYDPEMVKNANQEFFETAKKLGMRFVFGWGTCKDVQWHKLMDERLLKMGFTRDDFIFKAHLRDEFKKADIKLFEDVRKEIMKVNPGWTFQAVYLSTPPPSGATLKDIDEAKLTDMYKNWTLITSLITGKDGKKNIKFFRDHGVNKLWIYTCAITMHNKSMLSYYRLYPYKVFLNNIDGVAMWTSFSPGKGEDKLDFREGYRDGSTMLDYDNKPIPTKRLEAFSKGLEDVAYMFALQKEIKRLGNKLSDKELTEAKNLLGSKLEKIDETPSQEAVDEWRLTMGNLIDNLSKRK